MSQLDKTFPTNDCAICILAPKLVQTGRHENIDILINSTIDKIEGKPGNFNVDLIQKTLYFCRMGSIKGATIVAPLM